MPSTLNATMPMTAPAGRGTRKARRRCRRSEQSMFLLQPPTREGQPEHQRAGGHDDALPREVAGQRHHADGDGHELDDHDDRSSPAEQGGVGVERHDRRADARRGPGGGRRVGGPRLAHATGAQPGDPGGPGDGEHHEAGGETEPDEPGGRRREHVGRGAPVGQARRDERRHVDGQRGGGRLRSGGHERRQHDHEDVASAEPDPHLVADRSSGTRRRLAVAPEARQGPRSARDLRAWRDPDAAKMSYGYSVIPTATARSLRPHTSRETLGPLVQEVVEFGVADLTLLEFADARQCDGALVEFVPRWRRVGHQRRQLLVPGIGVLGLDGRRRRTGRPRVDGRRARARTPGRRSSPLRRAAGRC